MRKLKTMLVLLIAGCIIAACAALPLIVSAFHDSGTMGQAHYEQVPAVQLQIRDEQNTPAMAGLAMMYRMDGAIEISDNMTSMTHEEVEARSLSILQEYIDAGIVDAFEPCFYEVRCVMGQVMEDPSLNRIFWIVTIVSPDDESFAEVGLAIDDENGYLLGINYAREQPISETQRQKLLPVFADFYFGSLGIPEYGDFATTDLEDQYIGDNACGVRYRFGDVVYGEVNVDLYVYEYGFYTEFPDL